MGTSPLYYLAVAAYRLPTHPFAVGSAGLLWGYMSSWFKRLPRYDDLEFRRFLRSYQHLCLLKGKRRATSEINAKQEAVWNARHPDLAVPGRKLTGQADLLDVNFDCVNMDEAVTRCLAMCRAPRAAHTVVTVNASHLCMMQSDPELAAACRSGDLTVADGMSVVWALKLSGQAIPERVAGVDLMERLLEAANENGLSVYLLGAKPEVVKTLVDRIHGRFPQVKIAGYRDGYFTASDHAAIVEEIRASGADMLFIGMPSPFKETWSERYRERLAVPVIMGVGGSFDVLAGFIQRAPRWAQQWGLEWLWRLLKEPRKLWKRYLVYNSQFIWLAGREIFARRLQRPAAPVNQK
jgi:N-acetylglucosaminyldiphosphoundecaprenol N-acetyl-beta-D-mannosaminyltransferase